ncbi:hypothetical protein ACFYXF_44055 [Streptomyces sp. NPDC002680]|uniref:hypothetical protein n=1 Tax=Streptomyces sp. NPDC002680 TaxID=3364659 RepID=UPI003688791C
MTESPSPLARLAAADRLIEGTRVLKPRVHVALCVGVAVAVWFLPDSAVRPVTVIETLILPVTGVVAARILGRDAWLYSEIGSEIADRPSVTAYTRGLVLGYAAGGALALAGALLVPESWLRYLVGAAALWALWSGWRKEQEVREARRLRERSGQEPWYAEYRTLIEERRRQLS